jgi:hypothetical protein
MIRIFFVAILFPSVYAFSNYLKTLSSLPGESSNEPKEGPPRMEDIVPEEYYGMTNPMANSWPGSKHEKYGGYLKKLGSSRESISSDKGPGSPNNQSKKSTRQGGYLENL